MTNANLQNWYLNEVFTKTVNDIIPSAFPDGTAA